MENVYGTQLHKIYPFPQKGIRYSSFTRRPLEAATFLLQVDVVDREADLHRGRIDGAGRSPEPRQVRPRQHQAVPGQKSCQ